MGIVMRQDAYGAKRQCIKRRKDMEEREEIEEKLEELTQVYGVGQVLWALAKTLSTDKLKELVEDVEWSLGV